MAGRWGSPAVTGTGSRWCGTAGGGIVRQGACTEGAGQAGASVEASLGRVGKAEQERWRDGRKDKCFRFSHAEKITFPGQIPSWMLGQPLPTPSLGPFRINTRQALSAKAHAGPEQRSSNMPHPYPRGPHCFRAHLLNFQLSTPESFCLKALSSPQRTLPTH